MVFPGTAIEKDGDSFVWPVLRSQLQLWRALLPDRRHGRLPQAVGVVRGL